MPAQTPSKGDASAGRSVWAWIAFAAICFVAIIATPEVGAFVSSIRGAIGVHVSGIDLWPLFNSFQSLYAGWRSRTIVSVLLGQRFVRHKTPNGVVYHTLAQPSWPFSNANAHAFLYAEQVALLSVVCCFVAAVIFEAIVSFKRLVYKVADADKRPFLHFAKWSLISVSLAIAYAVCPAIACSIVAWWIAVASFKALHSTPYRIPYVKVVDDGFQDDPWLTPVPLSAASKSGKTETKEMACPGVHSVPLSFDKVPYAFLICTPNWESVIGFGFRISIEGRDRVVTAKHVLDAALERDTLIWIAGKSGRTRFAPKIKLASRALDYVYLETPVKQLSAAGVTMGTYSPSSYHLPVSVLSPPTDESGTFMYSSCALATKRSAFKVSYSANTIKGSSGSPIYTSKGIIGVHTGSSGDRSSPRNYGSILVTSADLAPAFKKKKGDNKETTAPHLRGFARFDENLDEHENYIDLYGEGVTGEVGIEGEYEEEYIYLPSSGVRFGRAGYSTEDKWEEMHKRLKNTGRALWADQVSDDDERAEIAAENVEPPHKTQGVAVSGASQKVPPSTSNGVCSKTETKCLNLFGEKSTLSPVKSGNQESASQVSGFTPSDQTQNADLLRTISRLLEQQEKLLSSMNGPHQTGAQKQKQNPSGIKPALSKPVASPPQKSPRTSSSGCSPPSQPATKQTSPPTSKTGAAKAK